MLSNRERIFFAFTTSMFWFSLYAYVAELSTYGDTLGASYRMIGLITGSYGLTQLILRIPLGLLSDHTGHRKIFIQLGLVVAIISSAVTFFSPSPISLLATRSLAGVSAATWVIFTVMFSGYFKPEEATKAIGKINSYNAAGQLVAMSMGGLVSYFFGTRYLFLLASIGAIVGLLTSFTISEQTNEHKGSKLKDFITLLGNRQLMMVSVLAILSQFITFATAFGFVPILAKNLGAKDLQLSLLTILSIIPAIFVAPMAGDLFPRLIGRKNTIITGFLISGLLCVIMPILPNLILLYIVQFISGVGRSLVYPLLMGLCIVDIPTPKRATAMGLFQAIYGIGMVLGPVLLGAVAQSYGLVTGFLITGLLGLVGIVITLIGGITEQVSQ